MKSNSYTGFEVAVIGMACKFPGASDVSQFWSNLQNGVESVSRFTEEELREYGNSEKEVSNPAYVRAKGLIENADLFDASFFGFSPNEASMLDPQVRLLAQCTYHALEDAGYDFEKNLNRVGLFAGAIPNINWQGHCFRHSGTEYSEQFSSLILNDKDFASTRLSYLLNLHGPSSTVYTACSTSLVTVDMACQNLLTGKCDLSVAGGVALSLPYKSGYTYEPGMIMSKDGHTRSFDAGATGTVWGDGVGMVVLKRLDEALNDGDNIYAIIKGSAINNDGNRKVGYTAPSVKGQAEVIREACMMAEVSPESISYIEGHGSATSLGDKIEITALAEAFKNVPAGYKCPIGSVKANVGHLNVAAGIAGFIKTCLMLKHTTLPPAVNFTTPNSKLTDEDSPFYINTEQSKWENDNFPLRAGVSSFGIGGTNVHVILEEAPETHPQSADDRGSLICLSGKTEEAFNRITQNLAIYIRNNRNVSLDNLAYTLQTGRKHFLHRKAFYADDIEDLLLQLSQQHHTSVAKETPPVVLMFPGMGSLYPHLGREMYSKEKVFRDALDQCFAILRKKTGKDFKEILYPKGATAIPHDFQVPQLLVFSFEYALAMLLKSWGIRPDYVMGYSLGEYVAACVVGVFDVETALEILIERGRLINTLDTGGMIGVGLSVEKIQPYLIDGVYVAIDNGRSVVLAGHRTALQQLKALLSEQSVTTIEVNDAYALHTPEMLPIADEFRQVVARYSLNVPDVPMVSNVTGTWCDENITSADYWVRHLSETVACQACIKKVLDDHPDAILLEVGAGNNLSVLVRRMADKSSPPVLINLVKNEKTKISDHAYLLKSLGMFWQNGGVIDWKGYHYNLNKKKLSLPVYPFEERSFSLQVDTNFESVSPTQNLVRNSDMSSWFFVPSWKKVPLRYQGKADIGQVLLLGWEKPLHMFNYLHTSATQVISVSYADEFTKVGDGSYELSYSREQLSQLFNELRAQKFMPDTIVDLTSLKNSSDRDNDDLLRMVDVWQSCIAAGVISSNEQMKYVTVSRDLFSVYGHEDINPDKSTVISAVKVIPQENPGVSCKIIETDNATLAGNPQLIYQQIYKEIVSGSTDSVVSFRGDKRWVRFMEPYPLKLQQPVESSVRQGGTYIIIGGLGEIGFNLGLYLLCSFDANVIVTGRSALPERASWDQWIKNNDMDNGTGKKISRIMQMEKAGGKVTFLQADSSSHKQMSEVFACVTGKYSKIDGVFHAAGVMDRDSFNLASSISREQLQYHLPAKAEGLAVTRKLVTEYSVDFVAAVSSLSSVVGGLGMTGYAAANQYLDSWIERENSHGSATRWIALNFCNWEGWKEDFQDLSFSADALNTFITTEEGRQVFERLLMANTEERQIAISPVDLPSLMEKWRRPDSGDGAKMARAQQKQQEKPPLSALYVAPQSDLEKKLVKIWEELFGFTPIGIFDDFMELGGDSLKAVTMLSHVHSATEMAMSLQDFFKNTTIKEIAIHLASGQKQVFEPIPVAENKPYYQLSSAQRRLFFLHELNEESLTYNELNAETLLGNLDVDRLKSAFQQLTQRHEVLRTEIIFADGVPVQRILEKCIFELEYHEAEADNVPRVIEQFRKPFDLGKAPLLRAALIAVAPKHHVLVIDRHHIISDAISSTTLIRDLVALYNGDELPALGVQYKDYAEWQLSESHSERRQKQEAFWMDTLRDFVPLTLPVDFPRRPDQSHDGNQITFEINSADVKKIKKAALDNGVTMFNFMLAAYNFLLSRITGQEEVITGTMVAGREHPDIRETMGVFVNALPLINNVSNGLSVREFVRQVNNNSIKAFENQQYPFEDMVARLDLPKNLSRNPVFDVSFVYQPVDVKAYVIEGVRRISYPVPVTTSKFDLSLNCFDNGETLNFTFEYVASLFKESTIKRYASCFRKIIDAFCQGSDQLLRQVDYMSAEEKTKVIEMAVGPSADIPPMLIHEYLEQYAVSQPEHNALIAGHEKTTYGGLNTYITNLSRFLVSRGAATDKLIVVSIDRSMEMVAAMLAIWKAGAAYVPIDPNLPTERLNFLLEDTKPILILTETKYKDTFTGTVGVEVVDLKTWDATAHDLSCYNLPQVDSNSLAYVIYTSGSTGNPKGVMIEHRSMMNKLHWRQQVYSLTTADRVLQKTPVTFDVSVWELFWWVIPGATLVLLEPKGERFPEVIADTIRQQKISVVHFVPSMLNVFLDYLDSGGTVGEVGPLALKRVFCSGEALSSGAVRRFNRLLGEAGCKLANLYGPTETTIEVSFFDCPVDDVPDIIPIGRPIYNSRLYVLDSLLNFVPEGVYGELCVGGVPVSRGYLNRPELTLEKFVKGPDEAGWLYRTGDIVRWLDSGDLEYIGRSDDQVKVRGFRIETGEIEVVLSRHEHITETVVTAITGEDGNKRLCAYFVADKNMEEHQIRHFLQSMLPEYMVPQYIMQVEAIPLTKNGKADKKRLPQPGGDEVRNAQEKVLPTNAIEQKLADIISQLLNLTEVSVTDNFFRIGGDSIISIQVVNRAREAGINIKTQDVFRHQTIEKLAAFATSRDTVEKGEQGILSGSLPLSPMQEWFFANDFIQPDYWNQSILLKISPELSIEEIEAAFQDLSLVHDSLRLKFVRNENSWLQEYSEHPLVHIVEEVQLKHAETESLIPVLAGANQHLSLYDGRMINALLLKTQETELNYLYIVIHHLAVDAVSWHVLLGTLMKLLFDKSDVNHMLNTKTHSYREWSSVMARWKNSSKLAYELPYWKNALDRQIRLKADYPEGTNFEKDCAKVALSLDDTYTAKLIGQSQLAYNTQVPDLLLLALSKTLCNWMQCKELVIWMEGHGREDIDSELDLSSTTGWFTSLYPQYLKLRETQNEGEQIANIKEQIRKVPGKGIGYGLLREKLFEYDGNYEGEHPLLFNHLGQLDNMDNLDYPVYMEDLPEIHRSHPENSRTSDIEVITFIASGRLRIEWSYSKRRWADETIEQLGKTFTNNLKDIIDHCADRRDRNYTPSDFPLAELDQSDLEEVLKEDEEKGKQYNIYEI